MDITSIIKEAKDLNASDLHFVYGLPIRIRIDGDLNNFKDEILDDEKLIEITKFITGEDFATIGKSGEYDFSRTFEGIRCRINIFYQMNHISIAMRLLQNEIPDITDLGLPEVVASFSKFTKGIVLITGETGSGKSTTLAALIGRINHSRPKHIVTLEDPIEYIHQSDQCTINQRQIGKDTATYETGLNSILREDPDIILIGEIRTREAIQTALTAAETGHLVFTTLHTSSAADTVDRIVSAFPPDQQPQIRLQLSTSLKAVLSQQLIKKRGGKGRTVACEIMVVNPAIRNLIREGKTPQIQNSIATSALEGSETMDNYLIKLARNQQITGDAAVSCAHDPDYVSRLLGMGEVKGLTVERRSIR